MTSKEKKRIKYSIIVLTWDCLEKTMKCLESIFKFTKDFEVIIVDNGSTDGTVAWLRDFVIKNPDQVKLILNQTNMGFPRGNNQGLEMAKGEYIIMLNNDTYVTPGWIEKMEEKFTKDSFIGAVGPLSNASAGRQMIKSPSFKSGSEIIEFSKVGAKKYAGQSIRVGRLFGWCIMTKRDIIDEIGGLDERFGRGGFEDNDLSLRLQLAGYKLYVAIDTFIFHQGQASYWKHSNLKDYMAEGEKNRELFYDKWADKEKEKKLIGVYRLTSGCEKYLRESMQRTSEFVDEMIVLITRPKDSQVEEIVREFPKVKRVEIWNTPFQEANERNFLLQEALKMKGDWCISVDGDEVYEDKFVERSRKMMSPRNPEIFGYWSQWKTLWKGDYYRADSTFGQFSNYRFWRLLPNQEIKSDHPQGHHCSSAPQIPEENLVWSNIRVKHLGYQTEEERQKKYEFYTENDWFPTQRDIGFKDYKHLIDRDVKLLKYNPNQGISLNAIFRNEEEGMFKFLEHVEPIVDEMVLVDTGSTDKSRKIIEKFAETSPVPIKIFNYEWCGNFSKVRNFAKSKATKPWILFMDIDERWREQEKRKLFSFIDSEVDAYLFDVVNFLEPPQAGKKDVYASTQSVRLFKNTPELFFTGLVHETLDDAISLGGSRDRLRLGRADMPLLHYGYLKDPATLNKKFKSYIEINKKQIEITDGKDARPYFNLALHFLQDNDIVKAKEYLAKAIEINPYFWQAISELASISIKEGQENFQRLNQILAPEHPFRELNLKYLKFLGENPFGHRRVVI